MKSLCHLWRGELALQDAFWGWAVIGGLIINVASSALFLFLIIAEHLAAAFVFGYVLSVPYNILVSVGVWRSAERYSGDRQWADLARIVTVIGMVLLSVT